MENCILEKLRSVWILRFSGGDSGGNVLYVGGSDILPAPFSPVEERELLLKMADEDRSARAALIEHNLRLVVYIARRFENTGINIEDLVSIGTIGLIKAVNTFDVTKKIKLATYASRCIENEILMYLRRNGKTRGEVSLDEPLNVDWDGNELLLSDIMGTDPDLCSRDLEDQVDKTLLRMALAKLSKRDRTIIELRYGLFADGNEKTQKEVADTLGISQSYISRLEKRIIGQLRKDIQKAL